jgi:hypothetical protein
MTMNRTTAKDRKAFVQRVRDLVTQAGGRDDLDASVYTHVIPVTKCGPLFVSAHGSDDGSEVGWVACAFLYPELAAEVIVGDRLNRHSGKWNFHYFSPWTVDDAVADFERALKGVLIACGSATGVGHEVMGGEAGQE